MAEERDTEYVQVRTPDIMRISEYVIKAKGINRTMAQFAEDCGIGASTLSRIANGKISKPLSEDTVKAIYEHRAPESKIDLDMFMLANGMRDKKEHERRASMGPHYSVREESMNRERQAKNAIVAALLERDVPIVKVPDSLERRRTDAPYGMRVQGRSYQLCDIGDIGRYRQRESSGRNMAIQYKSNAKRVRPSGWYI